ncbi:ankyrin [Ascobolus immersus RN42]|uniref:Ankyrin n=1 Tax=Ascobolus immersus RN42 TaxID=1160509 RepID=A0A3N4IE56_ASCIM|nr:ankyrin [Ascobolus immersus RN42]
MIDPSIRLRRAILHEDLALTTRIITANPSLLRNHDVSNKSSTSLHLAAETGNVAVCKLLIDHGHEDTEISQNVDADTPLICAARAGHEGVVQLLAREFPACVDWCNKKGMTALMEAAKGGYDKAVIVLLEEGVEMEGEDRLGNTALHFATAYGHLKVIRTLIEAGAEVDRPNRQGWFPIQYSFTQAAELYFKQLVEVRNNNIHNGRMMTPPPRHPDRKDTSHWSEGRESGRETPAGSYREGRRETPSGSISSMSGIMGDRGGLVSQSLQGSPLVSRSRAATPVFGRSERALVGRQRASSGS